MPGGHFAGRWAERFSAEPLISRSEIVSPAGPTIVTTRLPMGGVLRSGRLAWTRTGEVGGRQANAPVARLQADGRSASARSR